MVNERLLRLKTGAIDESKKLFGIFIYLWVLLSRVTPINLSKQLFERANEPKAFIGVTGGGHRNEIFFLMQSAEQRAQRQANQAPAAGAISHVKT